MKQKKPKMISWKRGVSTLLAAVMVLTAAPQTGLTTHAAERGGGKKLEYSGVAVDTQAFSTEDAAAGADGQDNNADDGTTVPVDTGAGGDTAQPGDGQTGGGSEESGDGSENGGDMQPENPGHEGTPDDTETPDQGENPGDTEEPGEAADPDKEQNGDGEDTADIVDDKETVSENTLTVETMAEEDALKSARSLSYKGEIKEDQDGDWTYKRLRISAFEGGGTAPLSDVQIVEILNSYAEDESQRFECVELQMADTSGKGRKIKKDVLNAANGILKRDHHDDKENRDRYWIDYNFDNEQKGTYLHFSLDHPEDIEKDISADVTVNPVQGLGVKVKSTMGTFPAENVSVGIGGDGMTESLAGSLDGVGEEVDDGWELKKYSVFTLASGKPAAVVHGIDVRYEENEIRMDIRELKAGTEYLAAPVRTDGETVAAGASKKLTPPSGATNVEWKSYTPDVASVSAAGELSAWEEGEALYGVLYKSNNVQKADLYRMKVSRELLGMKFLEDEITLKKGEGANLHLNFYPSDFDCDPNDTTRIRWEITDSKPAAGSGAVIELGVRYEDDEEGYRRLINSENQGDIAAVNPGTATVKVTYIKNQQNSDDPNNQGSGQSEETPITAECKITVEDGLEWDDSLEQELTENNTYAVVGCDTTLADVKLPTGWEWVNKDLSLAPYADTDGHDFAVKCTKEGKSGEFLAHVRMVKVREIVMTSLQKNDSETDPKTEWVDWNPGSVTEGDVVTLGFRYEWDNILWDDEKDEPDAAESAAVEAKLAKKYTVEWSAPKNETLDEGQEGQKYTAKIKSGKAEKKTFTVSVKEGTKVVWKTSRTLIVLPKEAELFDWGLIEESTEGDALYEDMEYDDGGKAVSITLKVKMPKTDYDKWKLTYTSLDSSILQLKTPTVTVGSVKGENDQDVDAAIVKIPCTQKSTGRVWIQVTAQDALKSSFKFKLNLEDKQPTILGAATKTINKAAKDRCVQVFVSTSEGFPLVEENNLPAVSVEEVKTGKTDASAYFELKNIKELSKAEAAALIDENPDQGEPAPSEPYIGVYSMDLSLKGTDFSGLKAGNYTVKLKFKTRAVWEENRQEEQSVSLTLKVTDVKPKVTFKQTKKVNLFYMDGEGAGTLQINTAENVTDVTLKDYADKNPNKNADCHYEVKKETEDGNTVYKIVRKGSLNTNAFNEKLKKGTLEYKVDGYAATFSTAFTVSTENKAPTVVLSAKSETLYPDLGYTDSWIFMSDKATGDAIEPVEATYYEGKGAKRKDTKLEIGKFPDDLTDEWSQQNEKEITGGSSKNKYGLFVTNDGNIVSRLREADSYKKNADTMNLEIRKANWSKPVAVSYKLQVESGPKAKPKLVLGKATLTLNKNAGVWRGQQERTTLRLKGSNNRIMQEDDYWVSITGQDDQSKAELKGRASSLVVQHWAGDDDNGEIIVRFSDADIAPGNYKFRIDAGKNDGGIYASTVLTVKIVDKTVKQSLKVAQKGSIDVLNREGTSITFTPKLSNLTGTVEDGRLAGKDADLFENWFEDGKLVVKARGGTRYSTKITYEVHTVFRVQTEDWRSYEISSANDPASKPFKIKVKQGKPKLTVAAVDGNTIYRQRDNRVDIRIEAMLGKQEVEIEDAWLLNYGNDIYLEDTEYSYEDEEGNSQTDQVRYNPGTKSVRIALKDAGQANEFRKNGTYKVKLAVRYCERAGDVKTAEVTCPIIIR